MSKALLRCPDCNRLLLLGPHNRAPAYRMNGNDEAPVEIPQDDEAKFRADHAGHRLGQLEVIEGSYVSNGLWGDPMRVTYFEATDGGETFVVRRWRTQIDRPVMYEVVPGSIEVTVGSIEAQTRDIERQLKADFGDALAPELIQQFTRTVEDIAGSLEYEDLEEVCVDGRDPLVSYLRLDEKHHAEILDRLGDDVSPDAIQLLEKFIFENCEGDDVMNLVVRKAFAIRNDHAAGLPSASA